MENWMKQHEMLMKMPARIQDAIYYCDPYRMKDEFTKEWLLPQRSKVTRLDRYKLVRDEFFKTAKISSSFCAK